MRALKLQRQTLAQRMVLGTGRLATGLPTLAVPTTYAGSIGEAVDALPRRAWVGAAPGRNAR